MAPDVLATPFPVTCAHGPLPQLAFAFWGAMYPKPKPVGHTSILRLQKSIFSPPESKTYPHLELCKNKDCLQRRGWNGNLRSLNDRQDTVHLF